MAEQRQPFRFRIPWLPGASVPARALAEPTQRPATGAPPVAAELFQFQPVARPPFRPAGIAQIPPPPPPKVPSPPRKAPQPPPSPPRMAPESRLPLRATTQPDVVVRGDIAAPPPIPSRSEVPPAIDGASPETNLKSEATESNEKPEKPVALALLYDPVKADPSKAITSTPSETSSFASVSQPSETSLPAPVEQVSQPSETSLPAPVEQVSQPSETSLPAPVEQVSQPSETSLPAPVEQVSQPSETSLPAPVEQLAADSKPTVEPLASHLVPSLAKADHPEPSSLTAAAQPSPESQPGETSLPRPLMQQVADEKPAKPIDSTSVPNLAAAGPPVPKELPPASQESSSLGGPITRPSGELPRPINAIFSKLQEYKRVEATDKEEAPTKAASSVTSLGKAKEKETPKGLMPSASASHEPKRSKQMKFVPKKRVESASSRQSSINHLESRPRPAAVRGSGSSSSSSSFQKEIKDDVAKFVHSVTSGKANTSTVQNSVDVLTLASENTGATMQLTSESATMKEHVHICRNYRNDPDESVEGTTDVEEEEGEIDGAEGKEESENSAFLNSNVQGVNNSVVLDSSVSEGSPGVHFELALNAKPQLGLRSEVFKDEFGITPTEKHTYKPTIRRRCLRGLFMESSDSDGDADADDENKPTKPRRHGCRFSCGWKNEEKHVDVT